MRWGLFAGAMAALVLCSPALAQAPFTYDEVWEIELTHVRAPETATFVGHNCVGLGGGYQIRNGTITATWTEQSMFSASLEMVFILLDSGEELFHVAGTSPLSVEIADVPVGYGPPHGAFVGVGLAGIGAAYKLPVALHISFDYVGPQSIYGDTTGICALPPPQVIALG